MLTQTLPTINLPASEFEGPLDLLLHLIREHRVEVADIPIVAITDQYIEYLQAMEEQDLAVAGEFFVMAATLLEIKTRMLLPKPPVEAHGDDEDAQDPREALIERLLEYEKYKALVGTLQSYEDARTKLFVRDQASYGDLYQLPVEFGELSSVSLLKALRQLLEEADGSDHEVTSVRRQKMSLKMAIRTLIGHVREAGSDGCDFANAFPTDRVRLDIIMTFLAMLELLRQGKITARQESLLSPIRLFYVINADVPFIRDDVGFDPEN